VQRPDGSVKYTWADGAWGAVVHVARKDGYKPLGTVDKPAADPVAAAEQLSTEQLLALLAKRQQHNASGGQPTTETPPAPTAGTPKTPEATPEAPKGKGKGAKK
jgi:hypothetical protein